MGMGAVYEALAVAMCVLISIALVAALVFEWRDDHKWMERRRR